MAYIHDHKILSGEEVVVGYVSAEIGLGARLTGFFDQGAAGAAAHGDPGHRLLRKMRATDHPETEP